MKVKFKKLAPDAVLPAKKTDGAIGYDLTLSRDVIITTDRVAIPMGFAMELPEGIEAKIEPRSGFSLNGILGYAPDGTTPDRYNADVLVGKIDPDYRGDVHVILQRLDRRPFVIPAGTRIAQMTFYRTADVEFVETDGELSDTDRDTGGFGHTGATDNTDNTEEPCSTRVTHYDRWVARDRSGSLWLHTEKPEKYTDTWQSGVQVSYLSGDLFPEVKWEDDEPARVRIGLIK